MMKTMITAVVILLWNTEVSGVSSSSNGNTATRIRSGCKEGFYGPNCVEPCSNIDRNCKACQQSTDGSGYVCTECNSNFYRDNGRCLACNYWCQVNSTSTLPTCRESDGFCEFGCKRGRYGYTCGVRCASTCKDECHRDTGTCLTGCKFPSYCGPTCQITCNDGCTSQQCNQSCNCLHGCVTGFQGSQCDKALAASRMCFGCDNMSSPQYCDAVVHCHSNEICFLESHNLRHKWNFRLGCMDAKACHRIETNSSSACVECCTTDMCNKRGCDTDIIVVG